MPILVLNSGSSSIKFSIFADAPETHSKPLLDAELSGIGGAATSLSVTESGPTESGDAKSNAALDPAQWSGKTHTLPEAIHAVLDLVSLPGMPAVDAVGYRVVHPGPKLQDHQRLTPEVLADLAEAVAFAPLHDPAALDLIREGMARFPGIPHFACFDTVFHRTMPEAATTYPIPAACRAQGVRRYGFHGLSCESIVRQLRLMGAVPKRMAIAHLGSGCSVTALVDGRSVDTSMGLTPTGGVVMGTRPGDLDPGVLLYLLRQQNGSASEAGSTSQAVAAVETMLNHDSGMVALSGLPNDVKGLRKAAAEGNTQAALALNVFTRSITKAIGGYSWLLGGLDAIVFSGGIGEHDALSRAEILHGLEGLGIALDPSANEAKQSGPRAVHASNTANASNTATAIFVVPAQEDLIIAMHVERMAASGK